MERDGDGAWTEQEGPRDWRAYFDVFVAGYAAGGGIQPFFPGELLVDAQPGDFIYFQGHASPGVYARAYLEGRFDEARLKNFRHELRDTPGL